MSLMVPTSRCPVVTAYPSGAVAIPERSSPATALLRHTPNIRSVAMDRARELRVEVVESLIGLVAAVNELAERVRALEREAGAPDHRPLPPDRRSRPVTPRRGPHRR